RCCPAADASSRAQDRGSLRQSTKSCHRAGTQLSNERALPLAPAGRRAGLPSRSSKPIFFSWALSLLGFLILVLVSASITIDAANRNSQCIWVQPTDTPETWRQLKAEPGFSFQVLSSGSIFGIAAQSKHGHASCIAASFSSVY